MTDRLAEFDKVNRSTTDRSALSASEDIESGGRDLDAEKDLAKFNREADAIDKVYVWANASISTITSSLSDRDSLPTISSQLDTIEGKLDSVRIRLQRISKENKELATSSKGSASPATMRIRISRTTKLANDFMQTVTALQAIRESHKDIASAAVKQDILTQNPHVTELQVDRALDNEDGNDLEQLLQGDGNNASIVQSNQLKNQVDELRLRNKGVHNLSKSLVALHQMFQEMSILVNGQQDLINEIEHNVQDTKTVAKKGGEELENALAYQRSARKKKICICVLVLCIVIGVVLAIVLTVCLQGNCNFANGGGEDASPPTPSPTPVTQPPNDNAAPPVREGLFDAFFDLRRSIRAAARRRELIFVQRMQQVQLTKMKKNVDPN